MEKVQLSGGSPGAGDLVCELLSSALGVLGQAGAVRGWDGSGAVLRDRVRLAQQVVAVAESVRLGVVRQVQARPDVVPGGEGGRAAATLLANSGRVDPWQARRDVAAAEASDPEGGSLPLLGAALAAGEVSRAHLDVAVGAVDRLPARVKSLVCDDGRTGLEWIDAFLVRYCREHSPGTIRQLVREMLHLLDDDRPDPLREAVLRRGLRYRNDAETGMVVGSFALDPVAGAEVAAALEAFAAPAPDGTACTVDGIEQPIVDVRSRPQRLADALAILAEIATGADTPHPRRTPPSPAATQDPAGEGPVAEPRSPAGSGPESGSRQKSATGRRARVDLSVVATWEQLVAAGLAPELPEDVQREARAAGLARMGLAGGGDRPGACLSPGTLARLACDATWRRVLIGPSGAPLDLGRSQRRASAGQRAALLVRDGGCLVPGCGMPLSWSDVHHHIRWADGGPTDLDNLYPACGRHHTEIHAGLWEIEWIDGLPWVRPPAYLDPARPLLRNTTHDVRQAARVTAQQLRLQLDPDAGDPSAWSSGSGGQDPPGRTETDGSSPDRSPAGGSSAGGECVPRAQRRTRALGMPRPRPGWSMRRSRIALDLCCALPARPGGSFRPEARREFHYVPGRPCAPP